jgi:hypothetical protein
MLTKNNLLVICAVFLFVMIQKSGKSQELLLETESFIHLGGWVIDQQFMDEMGSPYLLAHGLGKPVADAETQVKLPAGNYRLWVRTRNWVATWGVKEAPGKFQVMINNQLLDTVFGQRNAEWFWHDAGMVTVSSGNTTVKLHDLTGFEGRCDALYFTQDINFIPPYKLTEQTVWRRKLLGAIKADNAGVFDLIVAGGGLAGISAAITAARLGLKVALIQDRPVFGGNSSSEIRVWAEGAINAEPYKNLGNVVKQLIPTPGKIKGNAKNPASVYEDSTKLKILQQEKNITLFTNFRLNEVAMNGTTIKSVTAQNIISAKRIRLSANLFADCTGDATLGYLAGARYEISMNELMGFSNLWNVEDTGNPVSFPRCPWALDLSDNPFPGRNGQDGPYGASGPLALGEWYWESGFYKNPFTEAENIRDWNFRAMYGAWDCLKNIDKIYPNYELKWAAYIAGKRESRRLIGDLLLSKEDLQNKVDYPDGFIATGWKMDIHIPHEKYKIGFEDNAFISHDVQTDYPKPYLIPYRTLYSKNIENLFMAGRNISVSHDVLGTVRVMKTGGLMGEVVGMAAFLCKDKNASPREVYQKYLDQLKMLINKGL